MFDWMTWIIDAIRSDWMTCSIEAVGIVIFLIWIVIPIHEFGAIFRRLRETDAAPAAELGSDERSGTP